MNRNTQLWVAGGFIALIVIITVLAAVFSGGTIGGAGGVNFKPTQTAAISGTDHVRGNTAATVTVMEYGDFQCPACGAYEPLMEQLQKDYSGKILFVFRNFPLYQIHPNAEIAAQAAEAAGLQGKYWEMHDLLYEKQNDWVNVANGSVVSDRFDAYAQSLGLDVAKFNSDINSAAVKDKVQADTTLGNQASVDHTPTFFINLTQIPNPQSYDAFKQVVDAALASSTAQQ
ncbi:MAG TPA: thioredoxin domain-containing protein [Candidatus Paceibacterota bacterium]|nr:thioredoxin domain-containing protein [Candidatus Paceibacterota bacterium]